MSTEISTNENITKEINNIRLFENAHSEDEEEFLDEDQNIDYIKSGKSWKDLNIPLPLIEKLMIRNFKKPSKIQAMAISIFQKKFKKDLSAQSQNGSGKTLAFCIPALLTVLEELGKADSKFNQNSATSPMVIILGDTKELCFQTCSILKLLALPGINPVVALKDNNDMQGDSNIVVTTIGSFFYFTGKKQLCLDKLKLIIFDECDKLFSQDLGKAKLPMLFKRLTEKHLETFVYFFSATYPEDVLKMIESFKRPILKISIEKQELSLKNLTHYYIRCDRKDKLEFVDKFYDKYSTEFADGSSILFVNSKNFADNFCKRLYKRGHKGEILTSDMDAQSRTDVMNEFKAGKIKILVTTNLIARGIDNRKVSLVINLDLPYMMSSNRDEKNLDKETYFHRVGRTGRFGDKGVAINIIETEEDVSQIKELATEYEMKMIEVTLNNFAEVISQTQTNKKYNEVKRKNMEENI